MKLLNCRLHPTTAPDIILHYNEAKSHIIYDSEYDQMMTTAIDPGDITTIEIRCTDPECGNHVYRKPSCQCIQSMVRQTIVYWNQLNDTNKN